MISHTFMSSRSSVRHVLVIGFVLAGLAWPASAQQRAKVSKGLEQTLEAGGGGEAKVIYEGPQAEASRLAEAYGLRVTKQLASGAVLSGSHLAIRALAQDGAVRTLAEDARVFGMSAADPAQTTGANQLWQTKSGNFAGLI